jgi:hypothetical protein
LFEGYNERCPPPARLRVRHPLTGKPPIEIVCKINIELDRETARRIKQRAIEYVAQRP